MTFFFPLFVALKALPEVVLVNGIGIQGQIAESFLLAMSQFSFIVTLVATHNVLAYTKGLNSQNIVEFIQILPSTISNSRSVIDRESLQSTLRLYEDDLPSALPFDAELEMWQQHWTADRQLASQLNTPEKALSHADSDFYFIQIYMCF